MNILTFSSELESRMDGTLKHISSTNAGVAGICESLKEVKRTLTHLKEFAIEYSFQDELEEIKFFKEIKPKFLSQFYWYDKMFKIHLMDSFKQPRDRERYYRRCLKRFERFAERHSDFYRYWLSGQSNLDYKYFVRDREDTCIDIDRRFSTGFDIVTGKVIANELLKEHVLHLLRNMKTDTGERMEWTASKTDLIELVYALHSSDSINSGKVDIRQLALFFEKAFNLKLGNYYRTFQDIRIRKTGRAAFLDRLKDLYIKRIDEKDAH